MCCRYLLEESPELRPIIEEMNRSPLAGPVFPRASLRTGGEVRPADAAPVLARSRTGQNVVVPMKWGFSGKSLVINARSETAAVRPMFRTLWETRRCAVPASCYFEWEHRMTPDGKKTAGEKYRLQAESALTWLCGLFRMEAGVPCFVILTRDAGENIRFIHDRMPLILPDGAERDWLRPDADPAALLPLAQTELMFRPAG